MQICYLHYLLKSHFEGQSCIIFCPTIDLCQTALHPQRLEPF